MGTFPARRAIERLRAGLFDPIAADRLTMEERSLMEVFSKGLIALEKGEATHLRICGSYGQGKSHTLIYLQRQALSQGYAASLVQLDAREVPFSQFSVVYQSLMKSLSLPTGESFIEKWKQNPSKTLDGMPPRFQMILQALASKTSLPLKKARLKTKDFDRWLEEALGGRNLPLAHLKQILKARGVEGYREKPLVFRGNIPYVQMVQSLGRLLHTMGCKGLVLFFDEAESIVQGRLSARAKSYETLNKFFQYSGFVYPVFAFTESFFDQVRSEEYDGELSPSEEGVLPTPRFPQNYAEAWKNLEIVRLQDFSASRWEALQDRLINLYAEAYQLDLSSKRPEIKQQMNGLLEKFKTEETRFRLKALIHQLDIISLRTAS